MFSLLQKKTATVLSSLAVSFGALLVPVNMAQAAVFRLTIDGLEGSGEIGFDDESVDISGEKVTVKGFDLYNGYFDWSFSGIATTVEYFYNCGYYYDPDYGYYDYYCESYSYDYPDRVTLYSDMSEEGFSAFDNADFIFEKGELVGIDNYSWNLNYFSGPTQLYSSLDLDYPLARFYYDFLYYNDYPSHATGTSLNETGLQQFSTIVAWKNPNPPVEKVPEPNAVFALVGIGLLLNKKNRSHR